VKLLEGVAEIFGTEIAQGQELQYKGGDKFAVGVVKATPLLEQRKIRLKQVMMLV
jgi:hypothetical protein